MLFKSVNVIKQMSLLASACCMLLLVACGNEEGEEKTTQLTKKPTIGVLVYREDDPYIREVSKAIKESLGDKVTVVIKAAEHDQLLQNEQMDNFIAEKVSGLIVNLVDTSFGANISEKANKKNIPVIFFNREPDISLLADYKNTYFVGTMIEDAGILQGEIIKRLWNENPEYDKNKDGIIQYVMIQASSDNAEAIARTEYSVKRATENGLKLQQVGETLMAAWSENLAEDAIRRIWPTVGERIELIIANNDTMALGAIVVLQENGYNLEGGGDLFIPVIGVDAIDQAVEAINKGVMSGTVKQDALKMGQAIAEIMLDAVKVKTFAQDSTLQWSENGKVVRIPYSVLY